jgi:hypothetical protein
MLILQPPNSGPITNIRISFSVGTFCECWN